MTNLRYLTCLLLLVTSRAFAQLPDWIMSPPSSDTELYAIGEGRNLQQSTDVALKNLLGQLRTRISSSYTQTESLLNDAYSQSIEQSVSSSIENLPISQYTVLNNHKEDNTFYSLVSVSKATLIDTFSAEINNNFSNTDKLLSEKDLSGSELEWWYSHKAALLTAFATNARYIEVLDIFNQPVVKLQSRQKKLESTLLAIRQQSCLYVDNFKIEDMRLALRDQVVNGGLIADNAQCRFRIVLKDQLQERLLFSQHTASLTLTVTLEKDKRPIASQTINESGRSMSDQATANYAAYQRLTAAFKDGSKNPISELLSK